MAGRPCEGDARRPVIVVVDVILGLVAQTEAEKKTMAYVPIILRKEGAVKEKNARQRIFNNDGRVLCRRLSLVGLRSRG